MNISQINSFSSISNLSNISINRVEKEEIQSIDKNKVIQEEKEEEKKQEKDDKEIEKLEKRDREVREHEMAHKMAGGSIAGAVSYDYERGPDGKNYAVGGEVQINTSKGRTPEETIKKAQQIKRAALAPKDPSSQDRAVAAKADNMERKAVQEKTKKDSEKVKENQDNKILNNIVNNYQNDFAIISSLDYSVKIDLLI